MLSHCLFEVCFLVVVVGFKYVCFLCLILCFRFVFLVFNCVLLFLSCVLFLACVFALGLCCFKLFALIMKRKSMENNMFSLTLLSLYERLIL